LTTQVTLKSHQLRDSPHLIAREKSSGSGSRPISVVVAIVVTPPTRHSRVSN